MEKNSKLDVSIIIPHYNSWKKLDILLQTIPASLFDVIVVDDHSPDNELQLDLLQEKYKDMSFYEGKPGVKGAGAARNLGLEKVDSEWVIFADADDLFVDGFEELVKKYIDPTYDVIYFEPTSFKEEGQSDSKRHLRYQRLIEQYLAEPNRKNELHLRTKYHAPWSKLIRRSLIVDHDTQFDEIRYSNDVMFSIKIGINADKVQAVDETIYSIRESNSSLTSRMDEDIFEIRFNAWLRHVDYLKANLSRRDYKLLNISAGSQLMDVVINRLGSKVFLNVVKEAKKRKIKILSSEDISKGLKNGVH